MRDATVNYVPSQSLHLHGHLPRWITLSNSHHLKATMLSTSLLTVSQRWHISVPPLPKLQLRKPPSYIFVTYSSTMGYRTILSPTEEPNSSPSSPFACYNYAISRETVPLPTTRNRMDRPVLANERTQIRSDLVPGLLVDTLG